MWSCLVALTRTLLESAYCDLVWVFISWLRPWYRYLIECFYRYFVWVLLLLPCLNPSWPCWVLLWDLILWLKSCHRDFIPRWLIVAVSESVSWPCLSLLIVTLIETCHRDLVCVLSSWLCLSPLIVTLSESYYPYQSKSSYCECLLLWPCLSPLYCDLSESYYRDQSIICGLVCFLLSWSSHREPVCVLASWRCLSPLYCDLSESYYRDPSIICDLSVSCHRDLSEVSHCDLSPLVLTCPSRIIVTYYLCPRLCHAIVTLPESSLSWPIWVLSLWRKSSYLDLPESYYRERSIICDLVRVLLSWPL